ncbi:hypothetical protein D3C78_1224300 [compost metagenome]
MINPVDRIIQIIHGSDDIDRSNHLVIQGNRLCNDLLANIILIDNFLFIVRYILQRSADGERFVLLAQIGLMSLKRGSDDFAAGINHLHLGAAYTEQVADD